MLLTNISNEQETIYDGLDIFALDFYVQTDELDRKMAQLTVALDKVKRTVVSFKSNLLSNLASEESQLRYRYSDMFSAINRGML